MLAVRCGGAARQCAYARSCGADSRVHARSQRARPAAVAGGGCGQGGCCRTAARRRQRGRVAGRPLGTAFTHGQAPRPALLAFSTPRQCTDAAGVTPADPGESPARLKSPATADHLHVVSGVSTCTVQGNEESASRGRAPMGRGLFRALGHASGRQVFIQGGGSLCARIGALARAPEVRHTCSVPVRLEARAAQWPLGRRRWRG